MFGWEFPPHNSGGLGTACYGLSTALASDHQLTFVLPRKLDLEHQYLNFEFGDREIDVQAVNSLLKAYADLNSYRAFLRGSLGNYGQSLLAEVERYSTQVEPIAQRVQPDIIHAHDWLSFGAGIKAKEATNRPLVAHVHATEFDRTGGTGVNQQVYNKEREGLEAADHVIAVSSFTKSTLVEHYGITPKKISVVHNGVLPDKPDRSQSLPFAKYKELGYKIVLFVGRVTIQKGPDYFLKTAKNVLSYLPKTIFLMVGSGDMAEQMINLSVELGISGNIFFPGFLRGQELHSIYQVADVFVMPSVSEPFGITPLEAMLNGVPVIISKQSGVAEVITHGFKADFWDIEEMTNQIVGVLKSGPLRQIMSKNGRRNAKVQTWKRAADKCAKIYQQVVRSS